MKLRYLMQLAALSAWNRRSTLLLTICSIALSTFMLMGVERMRTDLRSSFSSAVSGTDLIVGARTGSVQLLLYAVFRVGSPTNNIRWSSVQALQSMRGVAWVVPLSLGDSHRGFPCLGHLPRTSTTCAMAISSLCNCSRASALKICMTQSLVQR